MSWFVFLGALSVVALALAWFLQQPKDVRSVLSSDRSKEYFRNKVVWITGASSGIGAELATQIARLGVNSRIVISARRVDRLNELARTLNASGGAQVRVVELDLADVVAIERAYVDVKTAFGAVDVLVNNAGVPLRRLVAQSDPGAADQLAILDVNLRSHIVLTTAVVKDMVARGSGHIVAVSSLVGHLYVPGFAAYNATKHALHGYYDSMRLEMIGKKLDIAVTIVCPGTIATEVWDHKWNRAAAGTNSYISEHFKAGCLSASRLVEVLMIGVSNRLDELWITSGVLEKFGIYCVYYARPVYDTFVRMKVYELIQGF
jgi:short-subunit dehydrogenase